MSDDESLSPASRLNSDSATSPVCAATATAAPTVTSCKLPSGMATRSSTSGPYNSAAARAPRSEEHTSELQSRLHLVCRLLLEKKKILIVTAEPATKTAFR